jgi:diguanylate cyclase
LIKTKSVIYKYAPYILVLGSLILLFITLAVIKKHEINYIEVLVLFIIIQIIVSIYCGIVIKKLYQQTYIDTLTGLYNRRCFQNKLLGMKIKMPISLILIDIDNFKGINDTYGHIVGDHVLQQFAGILKSVTRENDIAVRWGGEEFAVILYQTEAKEAFKIADRIRKIVEEHIFSYSNITCNATVSIGIATAKADTNIDIERLFKVADKALYEAKEKRNCVTY